MYWQIIFTFSILYFNGFIGITQGACVTHLSAHFGIEWCLAQYYLIVIFTFLSHLAVTQNPSFTSQLVITHKQRIAFGYANPVARFYRSGITCTVFLFFHFGIEIIGIQC